METGSNDIQVSTLREQADDEFRDGRYRNSMILYKQALELGEAEMDINSRLDVYETLAVCCHRLKLYGDAVTYNRSILKALESSAAHGYSHEATLRIRYKLARALSASSKFDRSFVVRLKEAVKLYKQNLNIMKAKDPSASSMPTRWSLASVLVKLSRHSEAELIYEQLMRDESANPEQFSTLQRFELQHEYPGVLYHLGRYQESKTLFLKLQDELLTYNEPKTRKLELLIQSTDRYIAACVEATADIELGSLRSLTAAASRDREQSATIPLKTAFNPRLPLRIAHPVNIKGAQIPRSHLKMQDNNDSSIHSADVKPSDRKSGLRSNGTSVFKDTDVTSTGRRPGVWKSPVIPPTHLDIQETKPGVKRSISDQAIGQDKTGPKPEPLIQRPKSAQPSENTQKLSDTPRPRLTQSTEGPVVRSRGLKLQPQTPVRHSSTLVAGNAPLTEQEPNVPLKVSSNLKPLETQPVLSKSKDVIHHPPALVSSPMLFAPPTAHNSNANQNLGAVAPQRSGRTQALRAMSAVPRPTPPKSSALTTSVQQKLAVLPSGSGVKNGSCRSGGTRHLGISSLRSAQPIYPINTSDPGQSYGTPLGANYADKWFLQIRQHSHALFSSAPPKNQDWKPVKVAIIDSGLTLGREDLEVPMAGELRRRIRIGHITYRDCTGSGTSYSDSAEKLHGTWCALLLLQMAPHAKLYIANVAKRNVVGQKPEHVADAIAWAIKQDVDIINMSFGWNAEKSDVSAQIDIARQKEILIFAAASNESDFGPEHGVYPANNPTVHGIYSCSGSGLPSEINPRASKDKPSFMFPGEQVAILTDTHQPFKHSERLDGTSFATPIATGAAALVIQLVRQQLTESAKEVERRVKKFEGISDVFRAMSGEPKADGYYHVRPWTMLGMQKPIPAVGVNESHQWWTLMQILGVLRRFGDYKGPVS